MIVYHIWAQLKPGVRDMDFVDAVHGYLGALKEDGLLVSYRVTRRMLGLGPEELLDFDIIVELNDLAQFDQAFNTVAARAEPIEGLHHAVNAKVSQVKFALYRDFPDEGRQTGQERF